MANGDGWNPAGPSVTAILCSYNRAKVLPATLEGLAASQMPSSVRWEVLVVDNNSTDQTREVVGGFCQRYPGLFRYVFEPTSGKSYALNTGVKHARGNVLAFIDDDVTVAPAWLHHLTASLHDGEWAGAGGRTLATESFTAPAWFSMRSQGGILFGLFDFGDKPRQLVDAPYGANMAFRKEMFNKYGGFRTDLGPGPNPETPRPNEDTEFGRRLMGAGERLRYEPEAVLYHPVLLERLNQPFLLAWWFDFGRARARELTNRPDFWGIRRDYLSMSKALTVLLPLESARWILSSDPRKRFRHKCTVWQIAGRIAETYHLSVRRQKKNGRRAAADGTEFSI